MNIVLKSAAIAAFLFAPVVASATPITGGSTVVRILVPLPGVTVGVSGGATVLGSGDVSIPITGGDLVFGGVNGIIATIAHVGSGISATFGANTIAASNLFIDTVAGSVTADVALNGAAQGNAQVFSFDISGVTVAQLTDLANPLLQLDLAQPLVDLLATIGVATDTDQRFGTVSTLPTVGEVPAPAALALFGLGIVGLVALRRRAA